jgi:NDP-sugar pyrophosphorylase family protein
MEDAEITLFSCFFFCKMKPTLLILAAGIASRYGRMKQMEGFGPGGETIMDYSIYDAIRCGFGKVIFVVRRDFSENFQSVFAPRLQGRIDVEFVYQEMDAFINGFSVPAERSKPWGTAHAVLCARDAIREPFAVINADDFYGRDGFQKAYDFLIHECRSDYYSIIGYELEKTLSDYGSVSRGVCETDENGFLVSIQERVKIFRENRKIIYEENQEKHEVPAGRKVSMNFWCFHPSVFDLSETLFHEFLQENIQNVKAEFFIPIVADEFIRRNGKIKVIPTSSQWFGVTYKEDAPVVKTSLDNLVKAGEYPERLWD